MHADEGLSSIATEKDFSREKWLNDFKRILRRLFLEVRSQQRSPDEPDSLREVIAGLRDIEAHYPVDQLLRAVSSELFPVNSKMIDIVGDFYFSLQDEAEIRAVLQDEEIKKVALNFLDLLDTTGLRQIDHQQPRLEVALDLLKEYLSQIEGVIMMGSIVHGGDYVRGLIKSVMQGDKETFLTLSDFDAGVVLSPQLWAELGTLQPRQRADLMWYLFNVMDGLLQKNQGISFCSTYNPADYYYPPFERNSFLKVLHKAVRVGSHTMIRDIIFYLQPIFPLEKWQANQEQILSALTEFFVTASEAESNEAVRLLLLVWQEFHYIKSKHLLLPDVSTDSPQHLDSRYIELHNPKTLELIRKVMKDAKTVMSQGFMTMLLFAYMKAEAEKSKV